MIPIMTPLTQRELSDVGTIPRSEAFYGFYNELESNSDVAGVCGRLLTQARTACDWINPIVAAQRWRRSCTFRIV